MFASVNAFNTVRQSLLLPPTIPSLFPSLLSHLLSHLLFSIYIVPLSVFNLLPLPLPLS